MIDIDPGHSLIDSIADGVHNYNDETPTPDYPDPRRRAGHAIPTAGLRHP